MQSNCFTSIELCKQMRSSKRNFSSSLTGYDDLLFGACLVYEMGMKQKQSFYPKALAVNG